MAGNGSSDISTAENPELTQQINYLFAKDPLIERRLLYISQNKYTENLDDILSRKESDEYYSIHLDLLDLRSNHADLYQKLLKQPLKEFEHWNAAGKSALKIHLKAREYLLNSESSIKGFITVRFVNNPETEKTFPGYRKRGKFFQIKGIVNSITPKRLVEYSKEFICTNRKCKRVTVSQGSYNKYFVVEPPSSCEECDASLKVRPDVPFKKYSHSVQEIMLEEESDQLNRRNILKVTVEDDLVDTIELGDGIFVVGTLEARQKPIFENMEMDIEFVLKANSIRQIQNKVDSLSDEDRFMVEGDWFNLVNEKGELGARDHLIASFEPDIHGMNLPKFLVLLALASSVQNDKHRAQSHILFIGSTGVAKSHLLLRAAELSPKGYFGGCLRASAAGLTVGINTVEGQKVYEMGILPKCDGGICCLDEFNELSEDDMGAIHTAMEQQTIHVVKGGVVAKLNSRCVIIAACNPRNLQSFITDDSAVPVDFNIKPALLSRFDVIFVLRDYRNPTFNKEIALQVANKSFAPHSTNSGLFSTEMLKKHLLATRDIQPKISNEAYTILKRYFSHVFRDADIDQCRATLRCLHALYRLTKAYARLLLKPEVTELDAVVIIRLVMENSYSMGRYSEPQNLVEKPLPLGPSETECGDLLKSLGLDTFIPNVLSQLRAANRPSSLTMPTITTTQPTTQHFFNDLDRLILHSTPINMVPGNPVTRFMEELEADQQRLTQKLRTVPQVPAFSIGDDEMDFLDELEMILNTEVAKDTNAEVAKSAMDQMETNEEGSQASANKSFKDVLKQFSYSQCTRKRPQEPKKASSSPKKRKVQPLKNSNIKALNDDLADIEFDTILSDIRMDIDSSPSTSNDKASQDDDAVKKAQEMEAKSAVDALAGLIDESFFEDDS